MRRLDASVLRTERRDGGKPDEIPVSELILRGNASAVTISGAVLEAAVEWEGCFVVFMTDDVPYEEGLSIHLLAPDLALLDSAEIAAMYSTGVFRDLELIEPKHLRFRFFADERWELELLAEPEFRWPFFSDPTGARRRFGFRRQFRIRRGEAD